MAIVSVAIATTSQCPQITIIALTVRLCYKEQENLFNPVSLLE